jgi:flagellar biosynthesis/type III secretory pathway chaperone
MTPNHPATDNFSDLESLCKKICHILEREHAVLRGRNGLIGDGVQELEQLHAEKDREIETLERLSKGLAAIDQARSNPDRAQHVREQIERCKTLQARNHQVFSRVVTAQRRIISLLRQPDEDVSLYDPRGRSRDYTSLRRAELA